MTAGVALGMGVAGLVWVISLSPPHLAEALARIDSPARRTSRQVDDSPAWRRELADSAEVLAERLGLARYRADLRLLDETAGQLLQRKLGYALVGLAFPPVL